MKNINVKIDSNSRNVFKDSDILGIKEENLQGNLIFNIEPFVDGIGILELIINDTKSYISLKKENSFYFLPIKSSLLKADKIEMQLRITENENTEGIPIFKSKKFYFDILDCINATETIPEQYPSWIDNLNSLVEHVNSTLDTTVAQITDLTDTYNTNAEQKIVQFNNNYTEKKIIIDGVYEDVQQLKTDVEGLKDIAVSAKDTAVINANQTSIDKDATNSNVSATELNKQATETAKQEALNTLANSNNLLQQTQALVTQMPTTYYKTSIEEMNAIQNPKQRR